jgi:homoserine O-acetyltransferase/O-succinyltransferase
MSQHTAPDIAAHIPDGVRYFTPSAPLRLQSGAELSAPTIAFQTWGTLNANRDNVIWVCHALTGNTDIASWWPGLFGINRPIDPSRDFVVCANVLGGCYGSAGPLSHGGNEFPNITIGDMVSHQRLLFEHLGINKIKLLLGGSMGGFQALEWAARFGDDIDALALVATASAQPAMAIALSDLQCQAIRLDPAFADGAYPADQGPAQGLALARQLGHLSYRSTGELDLRFARERRADGQFQVLSYLQHQGEKLVARFDANSYLRLNAAMNQFGYTPHALRKITVPTLVVSIDNDWLYPPTEQQTLAKHLPFAELKSIYSMYGHDGFLLDAQEFSATLSSFETKLRTLQAQQSFTLNAASQVHHGHTPLKNSAVACTI